MTPEKGDEGERKILSPSTWLLYSTALFAIILVPVVTGAFYMIRFSQRVFDAKNEYSVLVGIGVGIVLSLIVGYIYSNRARQHVE